MAGIYIHVPFCRRACRYCDFYFTVSLKYIGDYVGALMDEISLRRAEAGDQPVETLYLGGGTPSVLGKKEIFQIMESIQKLYHMAPGAEITIEANPDDLDRNRLQMLREAGFNRLSVGVQSFHKDHLELMNRSHTSQQAIESLNLASEEGFDNINMDLIYGLPGLTMKAWEENIVRTMELPVKHISAYHLTYEPGTIFHHWKKKGRIRELPEKRSIEQYGLLRKITREHGFDHYEISNFALPGFRSKHNSTYWSGRSYLGFGPSAHSYSGKERRWNTSSLKHYIDKVKAGEHFHEAEILSEKDLYHDYLITKFRTMEGADLEEVARRFGKQTYQELMIKATPFLEQKEMISEGGFLKMTGEGWLRSDLITTSLMQEP